jgi:hypothetical protein
MKIYHKLGSTRRYIATKKQVSTRETQDLILRFGFTKNHMSSLRSSQRVGSLSTLYSLKWSQRLTFSCSLSQRWVIQTYQSSPHKAVARATSNRLGAQLQE